MALRFKLRVDKRYSALMDYRWFRRCGFTRHQAYRMVLKRYGWAA